MKFPFLHKKTDSAFRIRFASAIALIAMLILLAASYFVMTMSVERSEADSEILQDISQQRTLSQRIVLLSERALRSPNEEHRDEALRLLDAAIVAMESKHKPFAQSVSAGRHESADTRRMHDIYFSSDGQLDYLIRSLIGNAKQLSELAADTPDIARIYLAPMEELAATKLLPVMDEVISLYRSQTSNSIAAIKNVHLLIIALSLALLGVVWQFIFRPLANQVGNRNRELVQARDEMRHAALHDGLTGLANRDRAITLLQESATEIEASGSGEVAVIHLDLDNFKKINDGYGHLFGDNLLETVGRRLAAFNADNQTVCRMGGDEFIIIRRGETHQNDLDFLACEVLTTLEKPMEIQGVPTQILASLGIAKFPRDANTAEELLIAADLALYAAKERGKGTYSTFTKQLRTRYANTMSLENDLDRALRAGEFEPAFQPRIDLKSRQAVGVELQIRWHHPERGVLLPEEFMPLLINSGRLPDINNAVLAKALTVAREWQHNGVPFGRLTLCVTAHELDRHDFVDNLVDQARSKGIPTDRLSLEISDSAPVGLWDEKTISTITKLREMGFAAEVGNTAIGVATLLSGVDANFDAIKLDADIIADIATNDQKQGIVKTIGELSDKLGLQMIAGEIDDESDITLLQSLGCTVAQGGGISPAMPASVAGQWLSLNSPAPDSSSTEVYTTG